MSDNWISWLYSANEWLINYSLPPQDLVSVKLFSIGHCLELYLKAYITKQTGLYSEAIKHGHKIVSLWQECKSYNSNFLINYELRQSILACNVLDQRDCQSKLSADDFYYFIKHNELFVIAKHLPDIKYFGVPWSTTHTKSRNIGCFYYNAMWIDIIKEIREHLEYPPDGHEDIISMHINDYKDLPQQSLAYLLPLFS